jgi:hypothetical protein
MRAAQIAHLVLSRGDSGIVIHSRDGPWSPVHRFGNRRTIRAGIPRLPTCEPFADAYRGHYWLRPVSVYSQFRLLLRRLLSCRCLLAGR